MEEEAATREEAEHDMRYIRVGGGLWTESIVDRRLLLLHGRSLGVALKATTRRRRRHRRESDTTLTHC